MPGREMHSYTLTFPHGLNDDDSLRVIGGLATELYSGGARTTTFEVAASKTGIEHRLIVEDGLNKQLLGRIRVSLPALRIEETSVDREVAPLLAADIRLGTSHRPIRIDRSATVSASLLSAMTSVRGSERVELQWVLSGVRPSAPVRQLPAAERKRPLLARMLFPPPTTWHPDADSARAEREKQSEPVLDVSGRIAVWCSDPGRGRVLMGGAIAALRSVEAPGVRLKVKLRRSAEKRFLERSRSPFIGPSLVNAAELGGLIGWPLDSPAIPGLVLGAAKQLPPPHGLSKSEKDGVALGDSSFPGTKVPLVIRDRDRLQHTHVIGPTGVGKSTLLANMALTDIEHGHGVVVLDPKRDLVMDLLDRMPEHRRSDVIVLDPADTERPVGFNPLTTGGRPPELVVDHSVSVFAGLFKNYWGPRTDDIFRASLLTLVSAQTTERPTLLDVPTLLTDAKYRRSLVGQVADPVALGPFWGWYESLSDGERSHVVGPVFNKLRAFLMRPQIRRMIGQSEPQWAFEEAVNGRKIILVPLSAGQLGEEASQLLGSLVVARLWQTVQGRTSVDSAKRRLTMLYMDEFQDFLHLPTSVGAMLAQARGLGLGLTLAHQHLGQLGTTTRDDVLANCRSRVTFQTNQRDAKSLAAELPGLASQDLTSLQAYEIFARIASGSASLSPASGITRPMPESLGAAEEIRSDSRERYGLPIEEVEPKPPKKPKLEKGEWEDIPIGGRPLGGSEEENDHE